LDQRGVVLAAAPFALLLSQQAQRLMEVSPVLVGATVHLAVLAPAARLAAGLGQSPAIEMAESVLAELRCAFLRRVAVLVTVLLLLTGSIAMSASGLVAGGPADSG